MKKHSINLWLTFLLFLLLYSGNEMATAQGFKYVGAAKCKMCHNSEIAGQQHKIWSGSLHANAVKSLSSPAALEYAQKNNIIDPAKEAKCLNCHSTFGPANASLVDEEVEVSVNEGVSCESCHGPGSAYKTKSIMQDLAKSKENGLTIPDQKVCEKCHNNTENPFNKPFDFEAAKKKIAHPKPKADE
jgi:hypothetical protein